MAAIQRFATLQASHDVENHRHGRKTWDSLPKALPGRRNIVMSRSARDDVEVLDYEAILALGEDEEIMIIGGGEIYALFMEHTKEVHKTIVHTSRRRGRHVCTLRWKARAST